MACGMVGRCGVVGVVGYAWRVCELGCGCVVCGVQCSRGEW